MSASIGVGPDRKGRIVHSARKETPGELAKVVTGRLEIAELELEATQDAERGDDEDLVRNRLRVGEHLVHRGTRVVDETEIGLEERLRPSDPVLGVRMLRLLGQLVGCDGVLERAGPASGEPLEGTQRPEDHHAGDLVPSRRRLGLEELEDRTGLLGFTMAHETSCEHVARAVVPLELQSEFLLDLDSALQQAGGDLRTVVLRLPRIRDRQREHRGVAGEFSPLHRGQRVGQRRHAVGLQQVHSTPEGQNPGGPKVVVPRRGQCLVTAFDLEPNPTDLGDGELEENVRPLETGRGLLEEQLQASDRLLDLTGYTVEGGGPEAPRSR